MVKSRVFMRRRKKVKSLSLGCSVRHVSCSNMLLNCDLIACRALYVNDDNPLDVSMEGFMATLKSPPTIKVPEWMEHQQLKCFTKECNLCIWCVDIHCGDGSLVKCAF